MIQLELFDEGPQPVQKWLHVWTEANKKAPHVRPYTVRGEPAEAGREKEPTLDAVGQRITQPSQANRRTHRAGGHSE